ncbi:MAG TPA: ankyrin repeat domain-containing protein, partial [Rubrobacter sp.]|nr:ankyrin repeat domain-containing protein [Rubrobacter sp.]
MNANHLLQDALDEEDANLTAEAIRQGADVNALWEDQTFLSAAVQIGDLELVRLLLSAGADPNDKNPDGTTALTWCGNAATTAVLLDAGASARYEGGKRVEYSSLHNAAGDGDVARLRLLIERGDAKYLLNTFDRDAQTPLHHAANEGRREAAQLLLDAGADPNLVEELFYTAISLAAKREDLDMVKLLFAGGADPAL